jgi:hypothetical protein
MTKPLYATMFLRMVLIAALLICARSWMIDSAYSADPPQVSPKDGSSQTEQSPEEAAGGKQNLQRLRKACDEDVKKLCPDIRPGGGRILQCLHGHESSLTPACRQVLGPRSSNP